MAKGKHAPAQRVVLPNGMWLLLYEDGRIKIGGYDRRMKVIETLNREGGAHVFVEVEETTEQPKSVSPRRDDLVTEEREVVSILNSRRAAH